MGLFFQNVLLPFLCISHTTSSCEMLEIQWSQHDYCALTNLPPFVPGVNLIKLLLV